MSKYDAAHRKRRVALLRKYGRVCNICGPVPKSLRIHMHHVVGIRKDPEAVMLTCVSCHDAIEIAARRRARPYTAKQWRRLYLLAVKKQEASASRPQGAV